MRTIMPNDWCFGFQQHLQSFGGILLERCYDSQNKVGGKAKKISLSSLSLFHRPGLDQITISYNFKINPISVSVSMMPCGHLILVVIAGVVVAAVGVGISSVGEGMVAIEVVVELGL